MNGMKLTGKCKEDFEKWFVHFINSEITEDRDEYASDEALNDEFYILPFSMQYGVYVDFFDSVGIYICIERNHKFETFNISVSMKYNGGNYSNYPKSRHEARTKAIEKANEIYNEKMVS